MKYSVIIPYRNREKHLSILLPRLVEKFKNREHEIIVVEQLDEGPFCKTILMNIAAKRASGEVFVFHDVDYYPTDNVSYDLDENVAIYPVKQVEFVDENNQPLSDDRIPAGYQYFKYDVKDHSGGVVIVGRDNFFLVNGFNSDYRGWGKEDDDFRKRFDYHGIPRRRNHDGLFYGLYHEDSAPPQQDANFLHNNAIYNDFLNTYWMGFAHAEGDVTELEMEDIPNGRWLQVKNGHSDKKLVSISLPTRHRVRTLTRTLQSCSDTIGDKSQVEILVKVDPDDTDTIKLLDSQPFPDLDIKRVMSKRHPHGYAGISFYHAACCSVAKGKVVLFFADDCVIKTKNWEQLLKPYQDGFGIINKKVNEDVRSKATQEHLFDILYFITIKFYRTIHNFGIHPYMDRWLDQTLKRQFPQLALGKVDMYSEHMKDNEPDPTEPMRPIIEPFLRGDDLKSIQKIAKRIELHLKLTGKK